MSSRKEDNRFSRVRKDPRFRIMPKDERKVKIDQRFKGMFTDKHFKIHTSGGVDKRGRPVQINSSEDLKRFYELSSDSEESCSEEGDDDQGVRRPPAPRPVAPIDLARGEGNVETSSDEDSDSDLDGDGDENNLAAIEHRWGELDKGADYTEEGGKRLALCNMDWDRIKASDIFVLLNSFKPAGGLIHSVKIYLSNYGKVKIEKEDLEGPLEVFEGASSSKLLKGVRRHFVDDQTSEESGDDGDDEISYDEDEKDEQMEFQREKLRQYQLQRLRYYYAVIEFDCQDTANRVYSQCNGLEFESSAVRLDLRFVPDDMTFEDQPVSMVTELPDCEKVKLSNFQTSALYQTKVELTWDETDRDRLAVTMKNFSEEDLAGMDVRAYLASSSGEESDDESGSSHDESGSSHGSSAGSSDEDLEPEEMDEEQQISKYKDLLKEIENKEEEGSKEDLDMEITWEPGLKEKMEEGILATKQVVSKEEGTVEMTTWEKYLKKKKQKKREKVREAKSKRSQLKEEAGESEDGEQDGEQDGELDGGLAAFSDDELPPGIEEGQAGRTALFGDRHRARGASSSKSGKRRKGELQGMTAEEKEEDQLQKAELALLMEDGDGDGREHFSLKAIVDSEKNGKRKRKRQRAEEEGSSQLRQDSFEMDVGDSRFEALYNSHLYNIDPSNPSYKKTKSMEKVLTEKEKRRRIKTEGKSSDKGQRVTTKVRSDGGGGTVEGDTSKSLSVLVSSVKNKAAHKFQTNKKFESLNKKPSRKLANESKI